MNLQSLGNIITGDGDVVTSNMMKYKICFYVLKTNSNGHIHQGLFWLKGLMDLNHFGSEKGPKLALGSL